MTTLLQAGAIFANDYTIVRPLSQGGMGAVYVVQQISTSKQRALKLMHPQLVADPELRRRFEQEARVGARIPSEHVVEVNAAGVDAQTGMPYLVMELLEGEDLASRIKRAGPMSLTELRAVFEQLCHAMSAAHAAGIVHRDLKPENIYLAIARRAGGAPFTVKVLDFGIAKLAAEAGTHGTTGAMGSPLWMAPEQTERGSVTPAADVWALGLIAYNALTGTHFWRTANASDGTMAQLLREIVLEPIPPVSVRASERGAQQRVPPGFDAWFARCVAREPSQRFRDASELWASLVALAEPLDATALGVPSSAPVTPAVISAPPMSPARPITAPPPAPTIAAETPAPMATTHPPQPSARWVLATALLGGALVAVLGLGAGAFFYLRSSAATTTVSAPASATATVSAPTIPTAPVSASATVTAPATVSAPITTAAAETTRTAAAKVAPKTTVAAPTIDEGDPNGPNGSMNTHVWKLKNGAHVRMIGAVVKNDSNVADPIVRKAVEWSAWQYNRCYDGAFGQQPAGTLPSGAVVVGFDIQDQLPRRGTVDRSDFKDDAMNKCVVGTLIGQTINAAGPNGAGHVVYSFKFLPN